MNIFSKAFILTTIKYFGGEIQNTTQLATKIERYCKYCQSPMKPRSSP
uniref:Uncharacterized protein n=1 Tax=Anguilla anguilla TaxID=7936 RepID=A0A0E9THB6_ANGAN